MWFRQCANFKTTLKKSAHSSRNLLSNTPRERRFIYRLINNLKKVINDLQPEQLFWVIKNDIKMTGMPSFGAEKPPLADHVIWSIAAFLKKLPNVSDEDFKAWSAP